MKTCTDLWLRLLLVALAALIGATSGLQAGIHTIELPGAGVCIDRAALISQPELHCNQCKTIAVEQLFACSSSDCRHRLCHQHLQTLRNSPDAQCPGCRNLISFPEHPSQSAPATAIAAVSYDVVDQHREKIATMEVLCHNADYGCVWKMQYGDGVTARRQYQKHWPDCGYNLEFCPGDCGQVCSKKDLERHKSECPNRDQLCEHCRQSFAADDIAPHQTNCAIVQQIDNLGTGDASSLMVATLKNMMATQERTRKDQKNQKEQYQTQIRLLQDKVNQLTLSSAIGTVDIPLQLPDLEEHKRRGVELFHSSLPFMLDDQHDRRNRQLIISLRPKARHNGEPPPPPDQQQYTVSIFLQHVPGPYDDEIDWGSSVPVDIAFLHASEPGRGSVYSVPSDHHHRRPIKGGFDPFYIWKETYLNLHRQLKNNTVKVRVALADDVTRKRRQLASLPGASFRPDDSVDIWQSGPDEFHLLAQQKHLDAIPFTVDQNNFLHIGNDQETWKVYLSAILDRKIPGENCLIFEPVTINGVSQVKTADLYVYHEGTDLKREIHSLNIAEKLQSEPPKNDHGQTIPNMPVDLRKLSSYLSEGRYHFILRLNQNCHGCRPLRILPQPGNPSLSERNNRLTNKIKYLGLYTQGHQYPLGELEQESENTWLWTLPHVGLLLDQHFAFPITFVSPDISFAGSVFQLKIELGSGKGGDLVLAAKCKFGGLWSQATYKCGLENYWFLLLKSDGKPRKFDEIKVGNNAWFSRSIEWTRIETGGHGVADYIRPIDSLDDQGTVKIRLVMTPREKAQSALSAVGTETVTPPEVLTDKEVISAQATEPPTSGAASIQDVIHAIDINTASGEWL